MSFTILTTTPSAAVAAAGTIAFTLPNAALAGAIKLEGNHVLYAEGLQASFAFPADFTLAYSGATVTVTYNGGTSIPANTVVKLQLEFPGENNYLTPLISDSVKDALGNVRAVVARPVRVLVGYPLAAAATQVIGTQALATTTLFPLAASANNTLDVPRTLAVKSSTTDTTQTITVRGTDEFGVAISEAFALNGTTAIVGKKAFKTVVSLQSDITLAGTISVGTNAGGFGLPFFVPGGATSIAYALKEIVDGAVPTAGTITGGDLTKASNTTKDVRGVWIPNTAADGAKVFEVVIMASDITFKGVPQFTA